MKRLFAAAALTAAVILMCVAGKLTVDRVYKKSLAELKKAEAAAEAGNEYGAAALINGLCGYWEEKSALLNCFVNHGRTKEVRVKLETVSGKLEREEYSEAAEDLRELKFLLSEIKKEQELHAEVVF